MSKCLNILYYQNRNSLFTADHLYEQRERNYMLLFDEQDISGSS